MRANEPFLTLNFDYLALQFYFSGLFMSVKFYTNVCSQLFKDLKTKRKKRAQN